MYTRSYRSHTGVLSRPLPPDYGGTALVIGTSGGEPTDDVSISGTVPSETGAVGRVDRNGGRGQQGAFGAERRTDPTRAPAHENGGPPNRHDTPRFPLDREPLVPPPAPEGDLPFQEKREEDDPNAPLYEKEAVTRSAHRLFPAELLDKFRQDDLLLLGLILLLLSEKEHGEKDHKEALLILGVLYLSGL